MLSQPSVVIFEGGNLATRSPHIRYNSPMTSLRAFVLLFAAFLAIAPASAESHTLRVMSFNIWRGGAAGGQPLEQTAEVIRAARADIVGIQEAHAPGNIDRSVELAAILGWHHLAQPDRTAILSRHPINGPIGDLGAVIELPGGTRVHFFNVHYLHAPYQPYQLLGIPYEDGRFINTEAEAIEEAKLARGAETDQLVEALSPLLAQRAFIVVTGDFNEPSHLDWTRRAVRRKLVPIPVRWPATAALADLGFTDAYRAVHRNETRRPGHTWTPTTAPDDPADRHDRIDFVLVAGHARVVSAQLIGESPQFADIVVTPYPSDHRAIVSEIELPNPPR